VERGFRFAVGIEDTFVPHGFPGHRALDEYELTQHYRFWSEDLGLAADAGATAIRYGFPWYRLNPAPGRFVWDWADRVVDRLDELGLEAIIDLVHYGTPLWLDNGFLNADFPARLAEFAAALAGRYRGRLRAWTPLNEPEITAMHCGEQGLWPPRLTGPDGYVKLVRAIVRSVVAAQRAVAEASGGQASFVHVEATFRYVGETAAFAEEVELLRARQFLVQDLLRGRVDDAHPWPPTCAATASATTTWPGRPPTRPLPTCSASTTTRTSPPSSTGPASSSRSTGGPGATTGRPAWRRSCGRSPPATVVR
jgi:beta-glucosidase